MEISEITTQFLKHQKGKDIILHLAALVGIPYSYYSIAYLKTNVEGTYNILEASKNLNTDQIIVTSTMKLRIGTKKFLLRKIID